MGFIYSPSHSIAQFRGYTNSQDVPTAANSFIYNSAIFYFYINNMHFLTSVHYPVE